MHKIGFAIAKNPITDTLKGRVIREPAVQNIFCNTSLVSVVIIFENKIIL